MTKLLGIFIATFLFVAPLEGQINWSLVWSIELDSTAIWDVDPMNQMVLYHNQTVEKRDQNGKVMLQQSFKSMGEIQKIDAQNPLKIALFSEEQQTICFLDNALALQSACLNLEELNINLAKSMSVSLQTDRLWIYDEPNSRIELITLRNGQGQLIQNVSGLLDLKTIVNIQEIDNQLFVFDAINQVAWFDQFGNFIDLVVLPEEKPIYPIKTNFLVADGKQIQSFNKHEELSTQHFFDGSESLDSSIRKMKIINNRLYLQTSSQLLCFKISQ